MQGENDPAKVASPGGSPTGEGRYHCCQAEVQGCLHLRAWSREKGRDWAK